VVRSAIDTIAAERVYLFGSRATGEARPLSDIDLAFVVGSPARWSEFVVWVAEEAPTLLDIDLIDLDSCDPAVRRAITTEGVLIYERTH
jgi:predicted nucleotidyltransferase